MASPLSAVHSDPGILSGAAVFRGTRVPVRILFEFLSAGDSLDKFLDAYPSVSREQATAVIEAAGDLLVSGAGSS
jgi:uncharacterized protein (DUF433 family)